MNKDNNPDLQGRSPAEIRLALEKQKRLDVARAEETRKQQMQEQQAAYDKMSLQETEIELKKAISASDLEAVRRWESVNKAKLRWVLDQVDANEAERLAIANAPAVAARQAKYQECINEMDTLNNKHGKNDADWLRLSQLSKEIQGLQ